MYEDIKTQIRSKIIENTTGEITGRVLQDVLLDIVNTVGENACFKGMATPSTMPDQSPDAIQWYMACENGEYSNFDGTIITNGNLYMFWYNDMWQSANLTSGINDHFDQLATDISAANAKANTAMTTANDAKSLANATIDLANTAYSLTASGVVNVNILAKMPEFKTQGDAREAAWEYGKMVENSVICYNLSDRYVVEVCIYPLESDRKSDKMWLQLISVAHS